MFHIIDAKDPRYSSPDKSTIDLQAKFFELPNEGFMPFTANPLDSEDHGRMIFADAVAGKYGPVADYVPPDPVVPDTVTAKQIRYAMTAATIRESFESWVAQQSYEIKDYWEYETVVARGAAIWSKWEADTSRDPVDTDQLFMSASTY